MQVRGAQNPAYRLIRCFVFCFQLVSLYPRTFRN
jgi:hypothetical protein